MPEMQITITNKRVISIRGSVRELRRDDSLTADRSVAGNDTIRNQEAARSALRQAPFSFSFHLVKVAKVVLYQSHKDGS